MKKIYLYTGFLIGFLFAGMQLDAQQTPLYSQYMVNKFLLNPAVAGGNGYTTVNTVFREQFLGFENAPRTVSLNAQTRLLNDSYILRKLQVRKDANQSTRSTNIGLGGNIFSDRNGIVTKTGFQFTYAYHVNFDNNFQVSLGLTGSTFQYKLDDSEAALVNTDDPLLLGNDKQFWVPDATIGIFITNNFLYAGAAMTDLFGSNFKLGEGTFKDNFRTARNYNFMVGSRYRLDSGFKFEPSLLVRATKYDFQTDINLKAFYQDDYWLGLSYRTNKTIVSMVGVSVDMFYFGYAFDASLGTIKNYSSGSHEIMMGVRFGDNSTRRLRWIKKDEVDFEM
jgi:type IX secretion system PorP/SprF family membrane protein